MAFWARQKVVLWLIPIPGEKIQKNTHASLRRKKEDENTTNLIWFCFAFQHGFGVLQRAEIKREGGKENVENSTLRKSHRSEKGV